MEKFCTKSANSAKTTLFSKTSLEKTNTQHDNETHESL